MLVNSVIIVLREVLEAALLVSVLLSLSRRIRVGMSWLLAAAAVGLAGALAYARLLAPISELFDGVGQELTNAVLQFGVAASLAPIVFLVARNRGRPGDETAWLPLLMGLSIALAIVREGSEIIIFVSGFLQMDSLVMSVTLGTLGGAAIGFSAGVLLYYLLLAMPERHSAWISLILIGLAASSMCVQATRLLIQADWVTVDRPLWDSSGIVSEQSLPGQMLYALIGYEATPTATEVIVYAGSIALITFCAFLGWSVCAGGREST